MTKTIEIFLLQDSLSFRQQEESLYYRIGDASYLSMTRTTNLDLLLRKTSAYSVIDYTSSRRMLFPNKGGIYESSVIPTAGGISLLLNRRCFVPQHDKIVLIIFTTKNCHSDKGGIPDYEVNRFRTQHLRY